MTRTILSFRVTGEEYAQLKALGASTHIRAKLNEWSKTEEPPVLKPRVDALMAVINCKVNTRDYEFYRQSATKYNMTISEFVKAIVL
jgi:hypothetical protein